MKSIEIKTSENYTLSATIFEAAKNSPVLIISSATGVKQRYYEQFAKFMACKGITVVTFDYLGIGKSLKKPLRTYKNDVSDWGKVDLEAIIQFAKKEYATAAINLLGHSIGGQIIGLAKSSKYAKKIILVASQSGYWGHWKGFGKYRMWTNWNVVMPFLTHIFGYLPSKNVTGMENLPKNVIKKWSTWCNNPNYLFGVEKEEDLFYSAIAANLTSFSIENDSFAPKEAVNWLTNAYNNTNAKQVHLQAKDFNVAEIGHFGVFKEEFKDSIWEMLNKEIEN